MIRKALILAAIVGAVLACVWLPWERLARVGGVALVILGSWLIFRALIVGIEYESRPRVWRAEWRRDGVLPGWGPEERRRLAELQGGVRR